MSPGCTGVTPMSLGCTGVTPMPLGCTRVTAHRGDTGWESDEGCGQGDYHQKLAYSNLGYGIMQLYNIKWT